MSDNPWEDLVETVRRWDSARQTIMCHSEHAHAIRELVGGLAFLSLVQIVVDDQVGPGQIYVFPTGIFGDMA